MKKNNLLYLQIVDNFIKYIELGVYKYNDKLPSVRSVAVEMGINPNTIQRAYQILETKGYITTIEKKGDFAGVFCRSAPKACKDPILIHTAQLILKITEVYFYDNNLRGRKRTLR